MSWCRDGPSSFQPKKRSSAVFVSTRKKVISRLRFNKKKGHQPSSFQPKKKVTSRLRFNQKKRSSAVFVSTKQKGHQPSSFQPKKRSPAAFVSTKKKGSSAVFVSAERKKSSAFIHCKRRIDTDTTRSMSFAFQPPAASHKNDMHHVFGITIIWPWIDPTKNQMNLI